MSEQQYWHTNALAECEKSEIEGSIFEEKLDAVKNASLARNINVIVGPVSRLVSLAIPIDESRFFCRPFARTNTHTYTH